MIHKNKKIFWLSTYLILFFTLSFQGCMQQTKTPSEILCGDWVSIGNKPNVSIFKEGTQFKITIYKKDRTTRTLKSETYLIVEENGNLFFNTGFRIDIGYNEASDVLTLSPNGEYKRVKP